MKTIEQRIRAARPAAPKLPPDFAARVMAEIERRGLTVQPARVGAGRRWLTLAGAALLLGAGVLLANGLAFELRMNGSLELLYFGSRFLSSFVASLPFDLLAAVILLGALAAWLGRRGAAARMALTWGVLISYGITAGGGLALAESGINEQIQEWALASERELPMLGPFYRRRARYHMHEPNFRMGRVLATNGETARILTPVGEEVTVRLPRGLKPAVGDHLRLSGAARDGRFDADRGQFCNPRRARRYFHHMGMGPGGMGPGMMDPGRGMGPGMGPGPHMAPGGGPMMGRGMGIGPGPGMRPPAAPQPPASR